MHNRAGDEETPEVAELLAKRLELWKAAIARGDAAILCQAIVEQREIPKALRARLGPEIELH